MSFELNPMPSVDDAITRIPKRLRWKDLRKTLHDLDFYDAITHPDGRITANLYATDDGPWNISAKRSVIVHVVFAYLSKNEILSHGTIVLPSGKQSDGIAFQTPRDAIIAAMKMHDHLQKTEMYKKMLSNDSLAGWDEEDEKE